MRKITEDACKAFTNSEAYRKSNTTITVNDNGSVVMKLFDSVIAWKNSKSGIVQITLSGYNTATTRERLNGFNGVRLTTKQGTPYLNGVAITKSGEYTI